MVRKEPGSCTFVGAEKRAGPFLSHMESMQHRIDRLENLVTSLVSQQNNDNELRLPNRGIQSQNSSPADSRSQTSLLDVTSNVDTDSLKSGQGMLKIDKDQSVYIGPSHWSDVLHEVRSSVDVTNSADGTA
jgi:hypothetical protein